MGQSRESTGSEKSRSGGAMSRASEGRSDATKASSRSTGASGNSAARQTGQDLMAGGTPQEQAEKIVGMAREQATTRFASQKDRAAGSLSALGSALHVASSQMRDQDEGQIAGYVDTAASQVDHLATMLREQDIAQLIETTGRFARREPALFLAAAFAVGFVGSRFLKSSPPTAVSPGWQPGASGFGSSFDDASGYGSGGYGSGYGSSGMGSGLGYDRSQGADDRSGAGTAGGSASPGTRGAQASFGSGAEGQ